MRPGAVSAENRVVTATLPIERRLYRRADRGLVGGVASGIAKHLGVPTRVIRLAFIGLSFAGGLGVALYGAYWIVLPTAPDAGPSRLPSWLEYVLGLAAAAGAVIGSLYTLPSGELFVPTTLACLGGALIWRQASD